MATQPVRHRWLRNPETGGYWECPVELVSTFVAQGWKRSGPDPAIAAEKARTEQRALVYEAKRQLEDQRRELAAVEYEERISRDPVAQAIQASMYHCIDCLDDPEEGEEPVSVDEYPFVVSQAVRAAIPLLQRRPWPELAWPTPEQWAGWFRELDVEGQEIVAQKMLETAQEARRCFIQDHDALFHQVRILSGAYQGVHPEVIQARLFLDNLVNDAWARYGWRRPS